jgi:DMSO reductase anchor subunit
MVGLGFLAVSFESGRPWRGMYLLGNLRGSWMSIEILSGAIFIAAAALDHFFSSPALKVAAACAALELVISHGFILYRARAMSAWNVPLIPLLFLSSALAAGGGLLLIMGALLHVIDGSGLIIVLTCLITDMIVWAVYVAGSRDIQFRKATDILRRSPFLVLVMGLGHLLPLSMLAALMLITDVSDGTGIRGNIVLLSGLCIIAGGVIQKIGIIKGVDYLRPILLGREKHGKAI